MTASPVQRTSRPAGMAAGSSSACRRAQATASCVIGATNDDASDIATSSTVPSALNNRRATSGAESGPSTRSTSRGPPRRLEPPGQSRGERLVRLGQAAIAVEHGHDHRLVRLIGPALTDQLGGAAALGAARQHPRLTLGGQPRQVGRQHPHDPRDHQPGRDHPARPADRQELDQLHPHVNGTPGPSSPPGSSLGSTRSPIARPRSPAASCPLAACNPGYAKDWAI